MVDNYPKLLHHGGQAGVTGSCHELRVSATAGILVDCGLFQGEEEERERDRWSSQGGSYPQIGFPVDHLQALVLTHVHLDHVGRIPHLLAAGFAGPILCSEPSAILLPLMLEDALKVGVTRDRELIAAALKAIGERVVPLLYGRWHPIEVGDGGELAVRLQPAGHILGSAFVELRLRDRAASPPGVVDEESLSQNITSNCGRETRIVFTGDLGAPHTPLLPAPKSPYGTDVLVLESTYGDRLHEGRKERRGRLQAVIERALTDRGTILVPAFALGRTQELLYELEEILQRNQGRFATRGLPWNDLEIIVDSPLASRFTEAYRQLRPFWDAEATRRVRSGRHPLSFEQLTTVDSHADHLNAVEHLRRSGRPCVVVAGAGMCTGGRIVNYLKALIGDRRTDIVFVGYQSGGTPGRAIQQYGPGGGYVVLDGKRHDIRAQVHTLSGYSAHADQKDLVNFVRRMRRMPTEIRLVHGEEEG
ncbi:MAG: MBL fold metallo-hydrolase, partial [Desulfuromonadales bacterium]|nr:MBL fold metallo-hydrolase [Desulfuromonadales bacterium]